MVEYDGDTNWIGGWMSNEELPWLYKQATKMDSIVEIGCWKGRSSHALLSGCIGTVHCVDTFLGSPDELDTTHNEAKDGTIYDQFMQNVGGFPNLKVYKMASIDAAKYFEDNSIDMIFIDGSHLYEDVHKDIKAWFPKCKKLFCGHDVGNEQVKQALKDCNIDYKIQPKTMIWFLER